MSHIAPVSSSSVSRPQTTHGATASERNGSDNKPAPAASSPPANTPAPAHAPAQPALDSHAMNVLIDIQAGLDKLAGNAAHAIEDVIERLRDHHHHDTPQPQPQPQPAPKPVMIPGGDAGAATLSSAAVAARLLEEGGMMQAAAQRSATWAQHRAAQQVAQAKIGITLLQASHDGYLAWQGRLAQATDGSQVSVAA